MPRPKRRFSQHFLSDPRILGRIADALEAGSDDTVLEIGPGAGTLTALLAQRVGRLIAIEKDRDLVPGLRARFPDVEIVEGDALEYDWPSLVAPASRFAVIGNIPYRITSPLIDKALTPPRPWRVVYLVQREVADRVIAAAGTESYGALSIGVQAVARAERLFPVPAGAFHPRPRVDSALLRLTPLPEPLVTDQEVAGFRRLVVGLFGLRRKRLLRGLRELTGEPGPRVELRMKEAGISPDVRPETLSPEDFARLYRAFSGLLAGGVPGG
jgi:16S rRNA (adenine1518-N6/adenine1519-N6)-dimethyltransferase